MKKKISLLLAVCMLLGLMTACGKSNSYTGEKILHISSSSAQTTANPYTASASVDNTFCGYLTSALYGNIPNLENGRSTLQAVLAESEPVDVSGNGTVWRMTVRKDAQWSNGEPINADTFMYGWKMCLDPKLLCNKASNLASSYVEIVNAVDYYMQGSTDKTVAWEDVGIKKIDDRTLEVTLTDEYSVSEVMRHFSQQSAFPVYEPMFEAGMNEDRTETTYGTDKTQIMCCGSFCLGDWIKGSEIHYIKNESWPFADLIKLDGMNNRVVKDNNTQIQMFEAGELDYVSLGTDGIEKYEEDPRFRVGTSNYITTIDFCDTNPKEPILANENFKKALYYGTDRETVAGLTKDAPAVWLISHMAVSYVDGTLYRDLPVSNEYLTMENYGYDPDLARECFDKAMEEEGLKSVDISMLYSTDSAAVKVMVEYLQEAWPKIFGEDRFRLTLNGMPNSQALDQKKSCKENPEAYELAVSRWAMAAGKYNPIRSLEVYKTDYLRRNAPYHCPEADALYKQAMTAEVRKDEVKLAEVTAQMEKVLLENYATIPVYEECSFVMFNDRVQLILEEEDSTLGWALKYADIIA